MALLSDSGLQNDFRGRFRFAIALTAIVFGLVAVRIWYLQILNGKKFQEFSEKNRINVKVIPAMRGRILDRNGIVIADSRPSFDLMVVPATVKQGLQPMLGQLTPVLGWSPEDLDEIRKKLRNSYPHDAVVIDRDMERDQLARLMAKQFLFPHIDIVASPARAYPFANHGSHLLGYLGEIGKEEMRPPYRMGDAWGVAGVERKFESSLRGEPGARPFIEDAWGREMGEEISGELLPAFQRREPTPGLDLVLSIDSRVQEAAEAAFTSDAGAVVALDPNNGDVLALVSRPEYAPEKFARGVSGKYWAELLNDPLKPFYDRTLKGTYPPGSTFKIVTALAALEEKVTTAHETVFCNGSYRLGREVKKCWKKEGHGTVDLHRAIKESCDVYFYEMGRRLGIDRLAAEAKKLGLGKATGIGINQEMDGLVPTEAWKKAARNQPWVGGETLSVAIGQGFLSITPLQLAVALSAVVNGGTVYQPRIALRSQDDRNQVQETYPVVVKNRVPITEEYRQLVIDGLKAVVQEPGGTAYWAARSELVSIGGKTGTAQVVALKWGKSIDDHAWFVAFAPVENPKIAVVVIVENGGHGGVTAAPIAKKVIETYLGGTS